MRRFRKPVAKAGELLVKYGQEYGDRDLYYCWPPNGDGMKRDSGLLMKAIDDVKIYEDRTLRQELELRGYDITTLKFSIKKKGISP